MVRSSLLIILGASAVSAYVPQAHLGGVRFAAKAPRQSVGNVVVHENFGLDFAEDQTLNTPEIILGEARLKQWVATTNDNSFLNRQYNLIRRTRELDLIKITAESNILSKLEKNGVDLETIESLLPALEKFGALSFVANNQQLLINLVAPLLVEPAPYLIPVIAGALDVGPPAFFGLAGALAGTEYLLFANEVQVPFIGLPAGYVLGLLLVPLTVVSAGAGLALGSAKK